MGLEYHHCRGTQVTSNIGGVGRGGGGEETCRMQTMTTSRGHRVQTITLTNRNSTCYTQDLGSAHPYPTLRLTSLQPLFTSCFLPSCGRYVQPTFLFLCHTHIPSSKHDNASSCRVDYAEITMGPHPWTVKVYAQLFQ